MTSAEIVSASSGHVGSPSPDGFWKYGGCTMTPNIWQVLVRFPPYLWLLFSSLFMVCVCCAVSFWITLGRPIWHIAILDTIWKETTGKVGGGDGSVTFVVSSQSLVVRLQGVGMTIPSGVKTVCRILCQSDWQCDQYQRPRPSGMRIGQWRCREHHRLHKNWIYLWVCQCSWEGVYWQHQTPPSFLSC